jgi:hypothetical protein
MSKQELIEFIEKVQTDPKWKDQADLVLLKNRFALNHQVEEQCIWHVLDELRNINFDTEENMSPSRADAAEIVFIVKLYLD